MSNFNFNINEDGSITSSSLPPKLKNTTPQSPPYICHFCKRGFYKAKDFLSHKRRQHVVELRLIVQRKFEVAISERKELKPQQQMSDPQNQNQNSQKSMFNVNFNFIPKAEPEPVNLAGEVGNKRFCIESIGNSISNHMSQPRPSERERNGNEQRIIHKVTEKRTFPCMYCCRTFTWRGYQRFHEKACGQARRM